MSIDSGSDPTSLHQDVQMSIDSSSDPASFHQQSNFTFICMLKDVF